MVHREQAVTSRWSTCNQLCNEGEECADKRSVSKELGIVADGALAILADVSKSPSGSLLSYKMRGKGASVFFDQSEHLSGLVRSDCRKPEP